MKRYESPEMEMISFASAESITNSTDTDLSIGGGATTNPWLFGEEE